MLLQVALERIGLGEREDDPDLGGLDLVFLGYRLTPAHTFWLCFGFCNQPAPEGSTPGQPSPMKAQQTDAEKLLIFCQAKACYIDMANQVLQSACPIHCITSLSVFLYLH